MTDVLRLMRTSFATRPRSFDTVLYTQLAMALVNASVSGPYGHESFCAATLTRC